MKLFQQMLVAPAALGLLAPLAANAAEVNINDVASYTTSAEVSTTQFSDVVPGDWAYTALQNLSESSGCVDNAYSQNLKSGQALTRYEAAALVNACLEGGIASADSNAIRLSNEFGSEMAILKGRVDGLEYKVEELSAGVFSSATKMSGGAVFTTGIIDTQSTDATRKAGTTDDKLATEYNFTLDLNTSFTGLDNLYTGFETGNQDQLVLDSQVNTLDAASSASSAVQVASLFYTFPVGEFTVSAGPLMDQDDVISATTSQYSSAFRDGELRWGTVGTTGAGAAISYVNENGWNGSFNAISAPGSNSTVGIFTEESADTYTASIGYDAENFGGGIVYTDVDALDTSFGVGFYFRPEGLPTISVVYDQLSDENADGSAVTDSSDLFVGMDYPWGPGTLSGSFSTWDNSGTTTSAYEVYYNYPVNDGVAVQGGLFVEEQAGGTDNTQGLIVETFFSF